MKIHLKIQKTIKTKIKKTFKRIEDRTRKHKTTKKENVEALLKLTIEKLVITRNSKILQSSEKIFKRGFLDLYGWMLVFDLLLSFGEMGCSVILKLRPWNHQVIEPL